MSPVIAALALMWAASIAADEGIRVEPAATGTSGWLGVRAGFLSAQGVEDGGWVLGLTAGYVRSPLVAIAESRDYHDAYLYGTTARGSQPGPCSRGYVRWCSRSASFCRPCSGT